MADSSVEEVLSVDDVLLVEDVVDELDAPEGGGGGGPCGRSVALVELVLDELSVDEVESALDREESRLWSCANSVDDVSVDDVLSVEELLLVDEVVDVLDVPEGGGGGGGPCGRSIPLVETVVAELSVDEVVLVADVLLVDELDESMPGGGPGGGPPAPAAVLESSPLESESSPLSEPPDICSCDRIDMRPDIAELMPVESTVDVLDVESELVVVDAEAEDDEPSVAAVWLDAELLWLCIVWWWEWVVSDTDKGISVGRLFDDASPSAIDTTPAPQTAAGRCSMWDIFPLTGQG